MVWRIISVLMILLTLWSESQAQDDLDAMLDGMEEEKVEYVTAAFKGTRMINLQTTELVGKNTLDFRIHHRFGAINGGAYEFFGLDQATIRIGLDYGVNDWLTIGIGRSTYEKTIDGFAKAMLLKQSTGKKVMPINVAYLAAMSANGLKWQNTDRNNHFASRLAYVHQLLISRKFNSSFSAQLSPTLVHKNLVKLEDDQNTSFAIGACARMKLSNRVTFNAEYIFRVPPSIETAQYTDYYNSLSIGFDIETGGHIFSLHVSNSLPMMEKGFITETNESWLDRGIHFGFNISREFVLR